MRDADQIEKAKKLKKIHQREMIRFVCRATRHLRCFFFCVVDKYTNMRCATWSQACVCMEGNMKPCKLCTMYLCENVRISRASFVCVHTPGAASFLWFE